MLWKKIIGTAGALSLAATGAMALATPAAAVPSQELDRVISVLTQDESSQETENAGKKQQDGDESKGKDHKKNDRDKGKDHKKDRDKKDRDKKDRDKKDRDKKDRDKKDREKDMDDDREQRELPVTGSTPGLLAGGALGLIALGGGLYLLAGRPRASVIA